MTRGEPDAPLRRNGYHVVRRFFDEGRCAEILRQVRDLRRAQEAPLVLRAAPWMPLRYRVIDGAALRAAAPGIFALGEELLPVAERLAGAPLAPWDDERVAVNVNITPPGGGYRWHYDRNPVTLIIYLNDTAGGEVELYPGYRVPCGGRLAPLQEGMDRLLALPPVRRLLGRRVVVPPEVGLLVAMAGDRCLHGVRRVRGRAERIAVVVSYGEAAHSHVRNPALDAYLYTTGGDTRPVRDPNYPRSGGDARAEHAPRDAGRVRARTARRRRGGF